MRVVIVGGSGFIGKNLALELARKGEEVLIFDKSEPEYYGKNMNYNIRYYKGDLVQHDNLEEVLQRNDVVVHLISTSFPNNSNINIYNDAKSNILPSLALLEACVKKEVQRVVFASSGGAIYGLRENVPISEEAPTNPVSAYGIHKLVTEKYMELISRLYGIRTIALRIANPYGIGQIPFRGQGIVSTALASALLGKKMQVWGDGQAVRDYIYISDVVNAFVQAICYNGSEAVFNIGSGIGRTINDLLCDVETGSGKKLEVEYISPTSAEVGKNVLDCSKAKKELKWSPVIDFNSGITMMLDQWDEGMQRFGF